MPSSWLTAGSGLLSGQLPNTAMPPPPKMGAGDPSYGVITPFETTGQMDAMPPPSKMGVDPYGGSGDFGIHKTGFGAGDSFGPQKIGMGDLAIEAIQQSAQMLGQQPPPGQGQPGQGGTGLGAGIGGATPGVSGPLGAFGPLDKYDTNFIAAGQAEGFDPNLLKAMAMLEHGWDQPVSPAGAVGIMQLMPNWESELGINRYDDAQNILGGAKVLKIKQNEGDGSIEDAIRRYHGYGSDGYTTDQQYLDIIKSNYRQLTGYDLGSAPTGGGTSIGGSASIGSLFGGGASTPDWGAFGGESGNGLYGYGTQYGLSGTQHTGIDVAMSIGTPMHAAFSGHVVCASTDWGTGEDGCAAFNCDGYCSGGKAGRIEIMSDDGNTVLIYGHSSTSSVTPGQRVNAGTLLGTSGGMNSAHVHLEARVKDPSMPSGWRIVDPKTILGGSGITGGGNVGAWQPQPAQPISSFKNWWEM